MNLFKSLSERRRLKNLKAAEEVEKNIQEAIDIAWATTAEEEKENQNRLFPNGKPTAEEMIETLVERVTNDLKLQEKFPRQKNGGD